MWGKKPKYKNTKCEYKGIKFDSKKEMNRYLDLLEAQKKGRISQLELQPKYPFIVNGKPLKAPQKNAKPLFYQADFKYIEDGDLVVEDVKSSMTKKLAVFKYKMALMKALYDITVKLT